jgi:hypothetical protein
MLLVLAAATCNVDVGLTYAHDGALYMKLAKIEAGADTDPCTIAMPAHGAATLTRGGGGAQNTVVATVAVKHVPKSLRAKRVVVDGTCSAKVEGYAVVTLHTLDDNDENPPTPYTVETARQYGDTILAAKLSGCPYGSFARAADRSAASVLMPMIWDELETQAQRQFLAAQNTPTATTLTAPDIAWNVHVFQHPTTYQRYVTVLARHADDLDVAHAGWEIYAVADDGTLTPVYASSPGLTTTPMLIEVDGTLMLLSHDASQVSLRRIDSTTVSELW